MRAQKEQPAFSDLDFSEIDSRLNLFDKTSPDILRTLVKRANIAYNIRCAISTLHPT